jgi:hypothetical protein
MQRCLLCSCVTTTSIITGGLFINTYERITVRKRRGRREKYEDKRLKVGEAV